MQTFSAYENNIAWGCLQQIPPITHRFSQSPLNPIADYSAALFLAYNKAEPAASDCRFGLARWHSSFQHIGNSQRVDVRSGPGIYMPELPVFS
jgi:hypothetical protein